MFNKTISLFVCLLVILILLGANAGYRFHALNAMQNSAQDTWFVDTKPKLQKLAHLHTTLRISFMEFSIAPSVENADEIKIGFNELGKVVSFLHNGGQPDLIGFPVYSAQEFVEYQTILNQIELVIDNTETLTVFAANSMQEQLSNYDKLVNKVFQDFEITQQQIIQNSQAKIKSYFWHLLYSLLAFAVWVGIIIVFYFRTLAQNNLLLANLDEARTTLIQTIDSISEGFALFDEEDRLILSNKVYRNMFELPDDYVGMTFYDICIYSIDRNIYKNIPGDINIWVKNRIQQRQNEETGDYQLRDGRWITVNDRKTASGNTVGIRSDITARVKAEQNLRKALDDSQAATKAKSEFLAIMSHEIRTPLNGVTGLLGLLLDTKLDPEQRGYVLTARESGELLLSVIEDILDFSKIEADKLVLEDNEFSPAEIVQHVSELLAPRAHDKGIDIACFIDPSLPDYLRGDQARLRQILLNLAGNAVKFTSHGGVSIELAVAASSGNEVTLSGSVSDTGIGIPYDKQDSLFDEFNQLDASYSRRFGGTGLGLAITRRLTEAMNGTVSVNSEPDHGSTFSFTIQLKQSAKVLDTLAIGYTPAHFRTILFWEQQSETSHIIARQIRADGHKVIAVKTENDALAQLKDNPIDIAIIDSRPKDETGPILARRLRERGSNVPTLLLEPTGGLNSNSKVVKDGTVTSILYKPVKIKDLRAFLDNPVHGKTENTSSGARETRHKNIGAGKRILLAEDSQTNRMVAAAILRRAGYRVDWVANGLEALESVKRLPYDLVLMDVSMPNMDGLEATSEIRALPGDERDMPIIALTAHAMPGDRERFLAAGMDAYLTKPLNTDELLDAIAIYCPKDETLMEEVKIIQPENPIEFIDTENMIFNENEKSQAQPPILETKVIAQLRVDAGEEALSDLLDIFLTEMSERVEKISIAAEKKDLNAIAKEAHALKSSSGSFGAIRMQMLALEIEKTAQNRDHKNLNKILSKLVPLSEGTVKEYQSTLSK